MVIPPMSAGKWKFIDHLFRAGRGTWSVLLSTVDVPFEDPRRTRPHLGHVLVRHRLAVDGRHRLAPARRMGAVDRPPQPGSPQHRARELAAAAAVLDRIALTGSAEIRILKSRHDATDSHLLELERHGLIEAHLLDPDSDAPPVESTVAEAQKQAGNRSHRAYVAVTAYGRARTGGCAR